MSLLRKERLQQHEGFLCVGELCRTLVYPIVSAEVVINALRMKIRARCE